jgi:hypothetical protein
MRLFSLLILAGALAVTVASAQAGSTTAPPFAQKVSITSAPDGPFSATGRALCSSGQVATTFNFAVGSLPDGVKLVVGKTLTCDDDSGSIDMVLSVRIRFVAGGPPHPTSFRWMITDGTGQYEGLLGSGTGVGAIASGEFVDRYTGRVRTKD